MNKADRIFKDNIRLIMSEGYWDENPRPKYEDGTPAHTIFIPQVFERYNIAKGDFPITTLRPIYIKKSINESRWIYQDQTSDLSVLKEKYDIHWWDEWGVGDGTIGQRYGATVKRYDSMNKLLKGLVNDPFGRRHIISLWQEKDFQETQGLLPCAFMSILTVRKVDENFYLDSTLIQRSSDYLVAGHINKMQYVAWLMMVAKHCNYRVGNFCHFVQNLHIYDAHLEQAKILLERKPSDKKPKLVLNVPDGTNFYEIETSDFELIDYEPVKPNLKFKLGI